MVLFLLFSISLKRPSLLLFDHLHLHHHLLNHLHLPLDLYSLLVGQFDISLCLSPPRWTVSGFWACSVCLSCRCGRTPVVRQWPWAPSSFVRGQEREVMEEYEEQQEVSTPTTGGRGAGCGTSSLSLRSILETSHCTLGRYEHFRGL